MGNKIKFGKRKHRGGLQDSLDTSVEIYEEEFRNLIRDKKNNYKYYCFDERCNQILFLGDYRLEYMWLYIQLPKDIKFDAIGGHYFLFGGARGNNKCLYPYLQNEEEEQSNDENKHN